MQRMRVHGMSCQTHCASNVVGTGSACCTHVLLAPRRTRGRAAGVLNVVHGTHDVVNRICDHPDIKAVSIVGSDAAGAHVYARACSHGKRAQANTGAKNHAVVMPDADVDSTVKALTGAAFGAAGQRCMAISAAVFVGGFQRWRDALREHAQQLKARTTHAHAPVTT